MCSTRLISALLLTTALFVLPARAAEFDDVVPADATLGEVLDALKQKVLDGDAATSPEEKRVAYAQARMLERRLEAVAKLDEAVRPDEEPEDARKALAELNQAGLGEDALGLHEFSWTLESLRDRQAQGGDLVGDFVRLDELANALTAPRDRVAAFVALARAELGLGREARVLRYAKIALSELGKTQEGQGRIAGAQALLRLAQDAGVDKLPATVQATLALIPSAGLRARASADLARAQLPPDQRDRAPADAAAEVEQRLKAGTPPAALSLTALAMPVGTDSKLRNATLSRIFAAALSARDFPEAQHLALGLNGDATQGKALLALVEAMLAGGTPLEAIDIPAMMTAPRERARAHIAIGRELSKLGYRRMAERSFTLAGESVKAVDDPAQRGAVGVALAAALANADFTAVADDALGQARRDGVDIKGASSASAAVGAARARAGEEVAALAFAPALTNDEDRLTLYTPLAEAALARGKPAEARALAQKVGSNRTSAALNSEIATGALKAGDASLYADIVKSMPESGERLVAEAAQLGTTDDAAKDGPRAQALLARVQALPEADKMRALPALAAGYVRMGDSDRALALATGRAKDAVLQAVAQAMGERGAVEQALPLLARLDDKALARRLTADLSVIEAGRGALEAAGARIRTLTDFRERVRAFRAMAEQEAGRQDVYGLLDGDPDARPDQESGTRQPPARAVELDRTDDLQVVRLEGRKVRDKAPTLPHLAITEADVLAMVPALEAGVTDTSLARLNRYNAKFFEEIVGTSARNYLFNAQKNINPTYIFLSSGVFTLGQVHAKLGDNVRDEITREGSVLTLRVPIVVGPNATLILSGAEAAEYRLSATAGAFIVNAGHLYVADTRLIAYDEKAGGPAIQHYENKTRFRPFITAWSDSETNIAGSELIAFGYSAGKTYGLSFTTGPKDLVSVRDDDQPPKGILVDNSFDQFLYGYYSYEAEGMSIIGNEYRENIVYGIDPHDRSKDLRIAYNTAYGSEKKHGIIVSREVDDSFIVGNLSFENRGSGIMLDRDSIGNVVYANTTFSNDQDGITLFESACNTLVSNHVVRNRRGGVKIRNSWDVALLHNKIDANNGAGIEAYIADLTTLKGNELRDFKLDPFHPVTTFSAGWNAIERNGIGVSLRGATGASFIDNTFRRQTPKLYAGDAQSLRVRMLGYAGTAEPVLIASQCLPKPPAAKACKLRRAGVLPEDGQTLLFQADGDADLCTKRANSVQFDALSAAPSTGGTN